MKQNQRIDGLFVPFSFQEHNGLTHFKKLLLSQIAAFKGCRNTDAELGEMLGVSAKTVGNNLSSLRASNLVSSYKKEGKRILNANLQFSENRGSWIPTEALTDPDLSPTDKLLLGNIASMQRKKDGCYASNFHFAKVLNITVQRVKDILTKLRSMGWVKSIEEAGRRLLSIAKGIFQFPANKTCTPRKQDGLHSKKNKKKNILPIGEKSSLSINEKLKTIIQKTGWLKKRVEQKGMDTAAIVTDLLKTNFQWVSENAARAYLRDFIERKTAAANVQSHAAAAAITERYREFFLKMPSIPQLQMLCTAADQYGVNKVRYHINLIGIGNDATKFNAASVIQNLQNNVE